MAGLLAKALSAFLKEKEELVEGARSIGTLASMRIHRREEAINRATGERTHRWQIEFASQADADAFDAAIRRVVDAACGEEA